MLSVTPFITSAELLTFSADHASDSVHDLARMRLRERLLWLHDRVYPEIRDRRWDVYFYPGWSLSPANVSPQTPEITSLSLRYTKGEMVQRLMQKQFEVSTLTGDQLATIGVSLDARGLHVEMLIPRAAVLDAQNFCDKVMLGAPEKRALRQAFADLEGDFVLTLRDGETETARVRCSRLVELGVLNAVMEKFAPGVHTLTLACSFPPTDPRLDGSRVADQVFYKLAALYPLYQFMVWAPRNSFLNAPRRTPDAFFAPQ